MELSGKVFKVMPVESGEGKNGVWKKQAVVIETAHEKYPKKVAVQFWGDLVNHENFVEGNDISVEFDVESREYNGKWYTDVKAWRVNRKENTQSASANTSTASVQQAAPAYTEADVPAQIDDDLPF
jgi:hypothetical protein